MILLSQCSPLAYTELGQSEGYAGFRAKGGWGVSESNRSAPCRRKTSCLVLTDLMVKAFSSGSGLVIFALNSSAPDQW